MRLRQVATVAHQLESILDDFRAVLGIEVAFRDRGVAAFGLTNAVMPVGDTFLEVVSPKEPGTTAGRYLEHQGGDAGYMVILQNFGDVDEFRRRVRALGIRVVWTQDHEDIRGTHLHPKDVGGAILSVDWASPEESWRWAGPQWRRYVRTEVASEIVAAEMTASDPEAMARRWSQVLEFPYVAIDDGGFEIALERGRLLFVPAGEGEREGVTGFHIECANPQRALQAASKRELPTAGNRIWVGGVELQLVAAAAAGAGVGRGQTSDSTAAR
jgi:hypothetical protein